MKEPLTAPADDAWLIQQSQQGNRAAFDQLQRKYQSKAFQTAMGFLGNAQDAEDITQDVFLRAYQRIRTFRGDSSFPTWLITIVQHLCLNKRRWWARRKKLIAGSLEEQTTTTKEGERVVLEVPDPAPTPAQQLIQAEQQQRLRAAIDQLDEFSRTVVILRCYKGMSFEDIAQTVKRPVGTVKSRFHRARLSLEELLEDKL